MTYIDIAGAGRRITQSCGGISGLTQAGRENYNDQK
jgi:hypothetical protein